MKSGFASQTVGDRFFLCSDFSFAGFTSQFWSGCLHNSWISSLVTFVYIAEIAGVTKKLSISPEFFILLTWIFWLETFSECLFEIFIYLFGHNLTCYCSLLSLLFYSQKKVQFLNEFLPAPSKCYFFHILLYHPHN